MSESRNTREQDLLLDLCIQTLSGEGDKVAAYIASHPDFQKHALDKTKSGHSLLYYAVKAGNLNLVKTLVSFGADLNETYDQMSLHDIVMRQRALANGDDLPALLDVSEFLSDENIPYNSQALTDFTDKLTATNPNSSQLWIEAPLKAMGYSHISEGYCHGVSHMGIQAMVLDERDTEDKLTHLNEYKRRIEKLSKHESHPEKFLYELDIAHHKNLLYRARINSMLESDPELQALKTKKDGNLAALQEETKQSLLHDFLTQDEHSKLDIRDFLDGIEIYQHSHIQDKDLFGEVSQQNVIVAMNTVANNEVVKRGGMALVDHFTGVYDDQELLKILQAIKSAAPDYGKTVAIELNANGHSISIGYDPKREEWIFIDANKKPVVSTSIKDDKKITDEIMNGLFANLSSNKLILRANIFSTAADSKNLLEKVIKPLHKNPNFVAANKVTDEKLNLVDTREKNWLDRAAFIGDDKVVQRIKQFHEEKKSFVSRHKKALLLTGGVLLGGAIITGSILSGGILPLVLTVVCAGVGAVIAGGSGAFFSMDKFMSRHKPSELAKQKDEALKNAIKSSERIQKEAKAVKQTKEATQPNFEATTKKLHSYFIEQYNANPSSPSPIRIVEPFPLDKAYHTLNTADRAKFRDYLESFPQEKQEKFLISYQFSKQDIQALHEDHPTQLTNDIKILLTRFATIPPQSPESNAYIEAYRRLSDNNSRELLLKNTQTKEDVTALRDHLNRDGDGKAKEVKFCDSVLVGMDFTTTAKLPEPVMRPVMR